MKKLGILFMSASVFATSLVSFNIQADDGDERYAKEVRESWKRNRENWPSLTQKTREYNNLVRQYPFQQYSDGIAELKDGEGVQKCLKWVVRVPHNHPKKPMTAVRALYDIGKMGRAWKYYDNDSGKTYTQATYENMKKITGRGYKALNFCSLLPDVPDAYD